MNRTLPPELSGDGEITRDAVQTLLSKFTARLDHWPKPIRTAADGTEVETRPLLVEDLFQTICRAVGLDPELELIAPNGRPLKIVDGGSAITELLG